MKNGKRQRNSFNEAYSAAHAAYKKKFKWADFCIYCGDPAETLDHVLAISLVLNVDLSRPSTRRGLGQGLNLVPCCRECNCIASNKKFTCIREKRLHIQKQLRKKYKKVLRNVVWDEEELSEMGYQMKSKIMANQYKRAWLEVRTTWPQSDTVVPISERRDLRRCRLLRVKQVA